MSSSVEVKHATSAVLKTMENAKKRGWQRLRGMRDFLSPGWGMNGKQIDIYEKNGKREIVRVTIRNAQDRRKGKLDNISGPEEFLEGLGDSQE